MNAPTSESHLEPATFELLPLTAIAPSVTAMQAERRQTYNSAALEELAASIRENGVAQPIVVRPLKAIQGNGSLEDPLRYALAKYELVAGERRWRASDMAGLAHIPAVIREVTDEQVRKLQLVENLHREALAPLAEARGYRELIDGGLKAELIGATIGKSRSYVYARVKLLELCPAVQEALEVGQIDTSQALLFARIPTAKLQEQALKTLSQWSYQGHGERLSFRRTAEILQEKGKGFLIPLAQVPFKLDDPGYMPTAAIELDLPAGTFTLPACTVCPKRSGNDPELLAALTNPDVCTDRACHDAKAKQAFERRRQAAAAAGREVLTGEAAAAISPTAFGTHGYIDLDSECDADEFPEPEPEDVDSEAYDDWDRRYSNWQKRTYRQLLGDAVAGLEVQLVQDPKHKSRIRELVPDKAVAKLLKEKGLAVRFRRDDRKPEAPAKPKDPEAARRAEEKAAAERAAAELEGKIEDEYVKRLLARVREAWKGPLKRDELELIAEHLLEDWDVQHAINLIYDKRPTPATLNERDLGRLILVGILAQRYGNGGEKRGIEALAKRLKIDPAAVRKTVKAELAPKPEGAPPAKKPAAKKGGKKK